MRRASAVFWCLSLLIVASSIPAAAAVKLPAIIGDNMVLQRGQELPIWGWDEAGTEVTVSIGDAVRINDQPTIMRHYNTLNSHNSAGSLYLHLSNTSHDGLIILIASKCKAAAFCN